MKFYIKTIIIFKILPDFIDVTKIGIIFAQVFFMVLDLRLIKKMVVGRQPFF